MSQALNERINAIQCLITDVDGVLTNGELLYLEDRIELMPFHVHDGYGLRLLMACGIHVAVITAGTSPILTKRFNDLKIQHLYLGQHNKLNAYQDLLNKLNLTPEQTAYIGDDLPDLPLIECSAVGFTVANANPAIKQKADWISSKAGGQGAVREICDLILNTQNKLDSAYASLQNNDRVKP